MINTTDFLDALRNFEYVAKQKDLPKDLKIKAREEVIFQLGLLEDDICNIDLGDEMEIFEGTNETLKNL